MSKTKTKGSLFRKLSLMLVMALGCSVCWAQTLPTSGDWGPTTITGSQTVYLTDDINIKGTITIDGGSLTIKPNGLARRITNAKTDGNLRGMFLLKNGANLYIGSTDAYEGPTITIGGGASWTMAAYDANGCVSGLTALDNPTKTMSQAVINVENYSGTGTPAKNTITLQNVVIQNVNSTLNCAGVRSGEKQWTVIKMTNCKFKNLKADSRTAVYACPECDGSITMKDCEVMNCITTTPNLGTHSPAIGGYGDCKMHMTLEGCHVHHNYGNSDSGGLYWPSNGVNKDGNYATLTLNGCEFNNNRAANYNGGGMDVCANLVLTGNVTKVHHNMSHTHGGGISLRTYNSSAPAPNRVDVVFDLSDKLQVYDNKCESNAYNSVKGGGGGVSFIAESNCTLQPKSTFTLKMNGAKIYNNQAMPLTGSNGGGGLYMENNSNPEKEYEFSLQLNSGEIYNNQAPTGGGLYVHKWEITSPGASSTNYVKIYKNTATSGRGGGMYVLDASYDMNYGQIGGSSASYKNESTEKGGGGVWVENGSLTMTGGNICYNKAGTAGGGVYVNNGSVVMSNSDISNNTASTDSGGGVCVYGGSLTMTGGNINNNTSGKSGGGAYVNNGSFTMTSGNINGNTAQNFGGGAYVNGSVTLSRSTLQGNKCENSGGAICVSISDDTKKAIIKNGCKLYGNQSNVGGGACYIVKGSLEILNENVSTYGSNEFYGNSAGNNGGAISVNDGNLLFSEGTVGKSGNPNVATANGGGINVNNGTVTFNGGTISYNIAHANGGGIRVGGGTVNISNATVNNNEAVSGGGLYIPDAAITVNFNGGTFKNNTASQNGGGIYIGNKATLNLYVHGDIQNNRAVQKGGGIYMNGTMNVAGNNLMVNNNNIGTAKALIPCNVYLPSYDKVITIVDYTDTSVTPNVTYKGVSGSANIGIYVDDVPTPVIASATPFADGHLQHLYEGLCSGNSELKDDRVLYQSVWDYRDNPMLPFNKNQIFFAATWNKGSFFENGNAEFADGDINPDTYFQDIDSDVKLARFMCYVNGLNGYTSHDNVNGKLTADIDMSHYLWLPIAVKDPSQGTNPSPYSGTFEGGGHVVTNLNTIGLVGYDRYGFIGKSNNATVKDLFLIDCNYLGIDQSIYGGVIAEMNGGSIINSESATNMQGGNAADIYGGLVGQATNAIIHSSMAMAEMTGTTMGGLVGTADANTSVKNCFSNVKLNRQDNTHYCGGLAAINNGTFENCYVRFESGKPSDLNLFGQLVGHHYGTVANCYYPDYSTLSNPGFAQVETGATATRSVYDKPKARYNYNYDSSNDIKISSGDVNVGSTLTEALNAWVSANGPQYTTWRRTMAGGNAYDSYGDINDDYPIPTFDAQGYTTVGSRDGIVLDYFRTIDQVLTRHNDDGILEGGTLNLYKNDEATQGTDEGVVVYIDENVSFLQTTSEAITAVTCQTMTKPNETWHLISSSLSASPIGFTYGTTGQVAWQDDVIGELNNPCNVSLNSSHASSLFPTDAPVSAFDLYSFSEPYYHWINLKRNSNSHWHMNAHSVNIPYTNETTLTQGKGYLAAIDKAVLLEASGTLNNGEVTIPVTIKAGFDNTNQGIPATEGTELKGYNLLGNPYQSYLDFATFASVNSSLWDGSATFALYDAETDTYTQGSATTSSKGSYAASGDINMHQGFFILADNAGTATFNNTMRSNTPASGTSFRGEERPAYPLINLKVTGDDGTNDIAVVEFSRPEYSAAAKMKHIGGNGKVYFHHNDEDCALLYLDEDIDNLPVRFETVEDGTYTLTWSTANATFSYLHLIDNMTGMDIDMLTSEGYTFQSTTSDYASRFKLVFAYTGVEEESETATEHFAFVSNGNLIVNGTGMFEMIDMNGRVISATRLTDAQNTVALPNAAAGVYVLKLTDSANSKVQKVVIR